MIMAILTEIRHEEGLGKTLVWQNKGPVPLEAEVFRRSPAISGFATENRYIQRMGCSHRINVFAKERDFAAYSLQEQHIVLFIETLCGFSQSLSLDFGNRSLRIGKG